jgi:hypothetical protein
VHGGPGLHERPIEEISVVSDEDVGLHIQNVVEESLDERQLVDFVEYDEVAFELGLGRVLEVVYVGRDDLAVGDEVALAVNHVRNHHDLVDIGVRKFQGEFGGLNVICKDNAVGPFNDIFSFGEGWLFG